MMASAFHDPGELMRAAGGRAKGSNSHGVPVERLTRQAKDHLAEIGQDDVSERFSLRLTATMRIHGTRNRQPPVLVIPPPSPARARCGG